MLLNSILYFQIFQKMYSMWFHCFFLSASFNLVSFRQCHDMSCVMCGLGVWDLDLRVCVVLEVEEEGSGWWCGSGLCDSGVCGFGVCVGEGGGVSIILIIAEQCCDVLARTQAFCNEFLCCSIVGFHTLSVFL